MLLTETFLPPGGPNNLKTYSLFLACRLDCSQGSCRIWPSQHNCGCECHLEQQPCNAMS
jgi:hypothetical protein